MAQANIKSINDHHTLKQKNRTLARIYHTALRK